MMSEIRLKKAQMDARFQPVRGPGLPQRVSRGLLMDAAVCERVSASLLQTALGQRCGRA